MIADGTVSPLPAPVPAYRSAPRCRWSRRPGRVIPLTILAVLAIVAGVVGYRTLAAFDTVHSLSTPPPEISDTALGGNGSSVIDTGPAREAVRRQQVEARQPDPGSGNQRALAATAPEAPSSTSLVVDARPPATSPAPAAPGGGTTILLMGVDARDGQAIDVGVRPDALAVLHIDDAGACRMLAIPRDSRAELPGYGPSKINHALAVGGIPYQFQVVEGYLGLDIDHYGLVDFAGVTRIVDSVGGITVDNPAAFAIDGQQFAAGSIRLDGERALLYARYRGGADGDFGRIGRQQQVLRAVMDRATEVNFVSLIPRSFSLLSDHIRTDLGPTDLVALAADHLDTCTAASLETATIDGDVGMAFDDLMQMSLSSVTSDPATIQNHVAWLLGRD